MVANAQIADFANKLSSAWASHNQRKSDLLERDRAIYHKTALILQQALPKISKRTGERHDLSNGGIGLDLAQNMTDITFNLRTLHDDTDMMPGSNLLTIKASPMNIIVDNKSVVRNNEAVLEQAILNKLLQMFAPPAPGGYVPVKERFSL